jgi:hypothetical protein
VNAFAFSAASLVVIPSWWRTVENTLKQITLQKIAVEKELW